MENKDKLFDLLFLNDQAAFELGYQLNKGIGLFPNIGFLEYFQNRYRQGFTCNLDEIHRKLDDYYSYYREKMKRFLVSDEAIEYYSSVTGYTFERNRFNELVIQLMSTDRIVEFNIKCDDRLNITELSYRISGSQNRPLTKESRDMEVEITSIIEQMWATDLFETYRSEQAEAFSDLIGIAIFIEKLSTNMKISRESLAVIKIQHDLANKTLPIKYTSQRRQCIEITGATPDLKWLSVKIWRFCGTAHEHLEIEYKRRNINLLAKKCQDIILNS